MLVIDAAAVRELFPMTAAIQEMREALMRYGAGTVVEPLRPMVQSADGPGPDAADLAPARLGHAGTRPPREDVVAGSCIERQARARGLGTQASLE